MGRAGCGSLVLLLLVAASLANFDEGVVTMDSTDRSQPDAELTRVLASFRGLAKFFGRGDVVKKELADGIFGIRTAQQSCAALAKSKVVSSRLRGEFQTLAQTFATVVKKSAVAARSNNLDYYHQFKPIISGTIRFTGNTLRSLPKAHTSSSQTDATFHEKQSDQCMSKWMGTGGQKQCSWPGKKCWQMMSSPHTSKYFLTHQVLFMLMANWFGCMPVLKAKAPKGTKVDALIQEKCAAMHAEMKHEAATGGTTSDIFYEQAYACGSFGFNGFFENKWLDAALKNQNANGCFKNKNEEKEAEQRDAMSKGRRLMTRNDAHYDETTSDGCSLHKSSVAAAMMSAYAKTVLLKMEAAAAQP